MVAVLGPEITTLVAKDSVRVDHEDSNTVCGSQNRGVRMLYVFQGT